MNKQVSEFVKAVKENARKVWTEADDASFIDSLLYVREDHEGTAIMDNYERFFDSIYRVDAKGNWYVRNGYYSSEKPYTFEKAMSDASIMYTG